MAFENGRSGLENQSMGSEMSVRGCEGPRVRVSVSSRSGWVGLGSGLNSRTNRTRVRG